MRLSERAYGLIKHRIITLKLPPLAVINERELMKELGLGRTPIREALHRLAIEKLVIIVPRRGMFVADISITDLHKIYEVRRPMEALCARWAAERCSAEQVRLMEAILAELDNVDPSDVDTIMAIDRRFHKSLYHCSRNEYLWESLERMHALSLRLWYLALDRVPDVIGAVESHRQVVDAIKERDPDRAEELINGQLVDFQRQIREAVLASEPATDFAPAG